MRYTHPNGRGSAGCAGKVKFTIYSCLASFSAIFQLNRGERHHRGRDRIVVGFATTHAIIAYHH
jgi:hypothetical protein